MEIEEIAEKILAHLRHQPQQSQDAMHLKLALEVSASKLFIALGWLLREGRVALDSGEHGVVVRCQAEEQAPEKIAERV